MHSYIGWDFGSTYSPIDSPLEKPLRRFVNKRTSCLFRDSGATASDLQSM
jgi:hypothetical protein